MDRLCCLFLSLLLLSACDAGCGAGKISDTESEGVVTIDNGRIAVAVGPDGSLVSLTNMQTGQDYAGGELLWRLYYDSPQERRYRFSVLNNIPSSLATTAS